MSRSPTRYRPAVRRHTPHPALVYRPPRYLRLMRLGVFAAVGAALLAAVYTAGWFYLAYWLRDGISAWTERQQAEGRVAALDDLTLGGFPGPVRLTLDRPRVGSATESPISWSWRADKAVASVAPWAPRTVHVLVDADQTASFPVGGALRRFQGSGRIAAEIHLAEGGVDRLAAEASGLNLKGDDGQPLSVGEASLYHERRASEPEPYQAFSFTARTLSLPASANLPLGRVVDSVAVAGDLRREIPPGLPLPEALAAWRDAGGRIKLSRLEVSYGPLDVTASGTLALDGALQPVGSLAGRAAGFFQTVEALEAVGVVRPRDASMIKVVLGVMAKPDPQNGRPVISLPLTIQDRQVFAGPAHLAEIPEVRW